MDDKFTQEECLILINGIRDYELLYNPSNQLYKSKANREMSWDNISSMVGKSKQLCKKKWRHLRDHYMRGSMKRGNSIENWCYYKPLSFLSIVSSKRSQPDENGNEEDEDDVFSETEDSRVETKRVRLEDVTPEKTEDFGSEVVRRIAGLPEDLRVVAKLNILAIIEELELRKSRESSQMS